MTTATEAGFLQAICAESDDDALRLIYADWLDEQAGGETTRSRWIRLGRESKYWRGPGAQYGGLARWMGNPGGLKVYNTWEDYKRKRLCGSWKDAAGNEIIAVIRAGFVDEIECAERSWMKFGDAITAFHPVREVALITRPRIRIDHRGASLVGRRRFLAAKVLALTNVFAVSDLIHRLLLAEWPHVRLWDIPR